MSAATRDLVDDQVQAANSVEAHRLVALAALVALTGSYLSVLHHAAGIVGIETRLLLVSAVTVGGAILVSRFVPVRTAAYGTAIALLAGMAFYLVTAPGGVRNILGLGTALIDTIRMLSGISILFIVGLDVWLLAVTPGPLFLSWYFVLRERYVEGVAIGLGAVTFFSATGDIGTFAALIGVLGATGVIGFGELHRRGARLNEADLVALLLAVMLIASLSVSVIPGGGAQPISLGGGSGGAPSTDGALIGGEDMTVSGNPSLDPTVRFTIEAEESANWRIDSFDRYTGDGWVQTGETTAFESEPEAIEGDLQRIDVEPESASGSAFPALWRPINVDGMDYPRQSAGGGLRTPDGLDTDDRYTVHSVRPNVTEAALNSADSPPPGIVDRYTQLPESTPDRVGELTADIIADAENVDEQAQLVEQYIIETNDYSLDVEGPTGDIADEQLFERDEGYCAFFATTMAVMLRTQDIPARVVTGYSSGERVAEDRWVVRGMNAHAWVEVYVPNVGWVEYDPTPSGPYDSVRDERLADAREAGEENVDTDESGGPEWQPENGDPPENRSDDPGNETQHIEELQEACENPDALNTGNLTELQARQYCTQSQLEAMEEIDPVADNQTMPDGPFPEPQEPTPTQEDIDDEDPIYLPDREHMAMALALVIAGMVGAHRGGLTGRARLVMATRWQGRRSEPVDAVDRAWHRLEMHLGAEYSTRRTGETVRAYVDRLSRIYDVDDRVIEVAGTYEHARYAPQGVDPTTARETVRTVDEMVGRRLPGSPPIRE